MKGPIEGLTEHIGAKHVNNISTISSEQVKHPNMEPGDNKWW